jgi:alpha-galactosidase
MAGIFGYELDLTKLTNEEKNEIKKQVEYYKKIRPLIQNGDLYRIISPSKGKENQAAWMYVSKDKTEAFFEYVKVLASSHEPVVNVKLKGLDSSSKYEVEGLKGLFTGEYLMEAGLDMPFMEGDYRSVAYRIIKKS